MKYMYTLGFFYVCLDATAHYFILGILLHESGVLGASPDGLVLLPPT